MGYALGFKVQTVFITDGLNWHCYSNLHKGHTEALVFSLTKENLLLTAMHLIQLLDATQSGHGLALLLVEVTEAKTALPASSTSKKHPQPPQKLAEPIMTDFVELTHINTLQLKPNQKPTQLRLPDGTIREIKIWKDILLECCRFSLKCNSEIPIPFSDKAGKKRFLLNNDKPLTGSSTLNDYNEKSIYIGTHYSATDCIANALHILKLVPSSSQLASVAVKI